MVAELPEERVGSGVGGADARSRTIGESFHMYVVFIDRQEKVFGAIFCADGKTTRKVGEHGVTS